MSQNESQSPIKSNAEDLVIAAKIVSEILLELKRLTKPGVSLGMLDEIAERMVRERGAIPYLKGYKPDYAKKPYPASICASVDEEICHAPPSDRELEEGQIVTYDLGVKYKTACGDAALTVAVGEISNRKARLLRYAERALYAGIEVVKAGVAVSKIGEAVEKSANQNGYNIVRDFGGHAIGSEMHEKPHIPNYYDPKDDEVFLKEGTVICIEPMLTSGKAKVGMMVDGWTAFTLDNQPVAMFEHEILVTKDSYEILTTHLTS